MANIGPYRIIAPIGESVQALSYRAVHVHLEREVFLKVLPAGGADMQERRARFQREAKALARIDHPAVVRVWDFGEADRRLYLASEFVRGQDLAHRIAEGALSWEELKPMTLTLLDGLEALHEAGIIHRDIKPSNIMLSDRGPKLADLGLARLLQNPAATQSDALVGTPAYLDPEMLRGGAVDPRADLFSLGATLYEALTGRRAFPGDTFQDVVRALLEVDPVKSLPAEVPPEARRFLAALLEKSPSQRPACVAEARALLAGGVAPAAPATRRPSRALAYGGLAVLCVLAGLAALRAPRRALSYGPHGDRRDTIFAPLGSILSHAADTEMADSSIAMAPAHGDTVPLKPEPTMRASHSSPAPATAPSIDVYPGSDSAVLWVSTLPWAEVWIDGEVQDTTPLTGPLALPAGRHEIALKHLAFPEVLAVVDLRPGVEESLFVSLADSLGFLLIHTDPWAAVQVDGVPAGTTPLAEPIALRPGPHHVMAENPFFPGRVERVRLGPGDTVTVEIDLRKTPER